MSAAWLEDLLPDSMLSPRTRICWVLFFLLFPLAYVGAVAFQIAEERPARIDGATDRTASIKAAETFAFAQGVNVAGWKAYVVAETNDHLLTYYDSSKQLQIVALRSLVPAREVQVLFRSPDLTRDFNVYLSLTGSVTGYDFGKSAASRKGSTRLGGGIEINSTSTASDEDAGPAKEVQNQGAEAIARRTLEGNPALASLVTLGPAKANVNDDDPMRSDVEWDASPPGRKEITLHIKASVRDSQMVRMRVEAAIDKDYAKANLGKGSRLPAFFNGAYYCFLAFGVVDALYRYAKRTLQKEVSHARTLVVAALFCVSFSALTYTIGIDQVAVRLSGKMFQEVSIISYIASIFSFAIMGLLVGIAYGSGEGEAREAYPGKLTSLDALLAGRIFSQNVAASILFGAAAAGWLLLLQHAVSHFLSTDVTALRSDALRYTFARLPWMTLLIGKQYDSLLIAVAGLLLPASFLLRRGRSKRRRLTWLVVFALCSVLRDAAGYSTAGSSVLAVVILASALLLPFFAFDLLAAMVSLSALSYLNTLVTLGAVFPSWTGFAIWLAAVGVGGLALAAWLALRGSRVREEDVRPTYAKNLAERMSMQAEILAAREAQLRLLPQSAPEIPGVQLAAFCLPARGVGGDFYDFFPLDANRVGIFVAQGGDQGLASALCIALAKGILMHASTQPHSPTQIVLELEASIAELLEDGARNNRISFAYGVMDTRRNLLNYARLGSSPRVLVHRPATGLTTSAQLEREAAVAGRPNAAPQVHEGAVLIQPGDYLIFFTDGLTTLRLRGRSRDRNRVVGRGRGKREYQWLDILFSGLQRHDEPLQASLLTALAKYQNQSADDLTAVVVRVVESSALRQEVVA